MPRSRWILPLTATLVFVGARTSRAQTTYTDRASFLGAFTATGPAAGTDPLDLVVIPDPLFSLSTATGLQFGITTGTISDPDPDPIFPDRTLGPAGFGTGQSWTVSSGGTTRLTFANGVRGFGAQFYSLASVDDVLFRFFLGGASVGTQTFDRFPGAPGQDPGYYGFYGIALGTAFDRLDIEAPPGEFYEMDDLVGGGTRTTSITPEPGTVALVAAGLTLLGLHRRRPVGRVGVEPVNADA